MGKKVPNIIIYKKSLLNKSIPSIKKSNKKNNQFNRKKKKNRHKKHQKTFPSTNISPNKEDKFLNQSDLLLFNYLNNNKNEEEKPVWMSYGTKAIENIDIRFNKEIYDYVSYIIPKNNSLNERLNTKKILVNIIEKCQPEWKVILFGSFSQNTSTIFSDLDFAIVNNDNNSSKKLDINELIYLMKILRHNGFSKNIRFIRARVPVLKATCNFTGIDVGITVKNQNGFQGDIIIRKILKKYKILKPSIIFLKILLKKNNFNNAQIGGMNSFLLFHLVYFYFIIYKKRNERNISNNNIISNEDEKENNSSTDNNSNIKKKYYEEDNKGKDYDHNNYFEEKINIYDSNNDLKFNGNNKIFENRIIISKPILLSNKIDNLSDIDSNSLKDINLLNNSEEENKNNESVNFDNIDENEYEEEDENDYNDYSKYYIDKEEDKYNDEIYSNIGYFIFTFLKFYGKEFDYKQLGFSLNESNFGNTFFKVERTDMNCNNNICVESIQDKGVDIGRICYLYPKIVYLFRTTYDKIKIEKKNNTCSILQSLDFPTI